MRYHDFHVIFGGEGFEGVLTTLTHYGFSGVAVAFPEDQMGRVKEVLGKAWRMGLEAFSRYDITAKDEEDLRRQVAKYRKMVDHLALEWIPPKLLARLDLRDISILNIEIVPRSTAIKLKSQGKALEFNLKRLTCYLKDDPNRFKRMIQSATLYDRLGLPIIVTSGAQKPLEIYPPLQLLYAYLGLIGKREVSKRYIVNPFLEGVSNQLFPL